MPLPLCLRCLLCSFLLPSFAPFFQSHARRDLLLQIQSDVQGLWEQEKAFEANARDAATATGTGDVASSGQAQVNGRESGSVPPREKFFGNFPYPYMNGLLHLGHAFTLSKVEFACAYHRLRGANALFPFGFHCTGMPIKVR